MSGGKTICGNHIEWLGRSFSAARKGKQELFVPSAIIIQEVQKPEEDGDLRDVEVSGQDERPDEVVATVASNLETWNLGSGEK